MKQFFLKMSPWKHIPSGHIYSESELPVSVDDPESMKLLSHSIKSQTIIPFEGFVQNIPPPDIEGMGKFVSILIEVLPTQYKPRVYVNSELVPRGGISLKLPENTIVAASDIDTIASDEVAPNDDCAIHHQSVSVNGQKIPHGGADVGFFPNGNRFARIYFPVIANLGTGEVVVIYWDKLIQSLTIKPLDGPEVVVLNDGKPIG